MEAPDDSTILDEKVAALREALSGVHIADAHFLADRVMFSLAIDVIEHAIAVQLLRSSEAPRAAFANARAALESALDLILLLESEEGFDHNAGLAFVHEVHETFRIQARFGRADAAGGYDVRPVRDLRRHILAEIASLADIAPSSSEALGRALDEFESRNSAQKKHWSGKTREQIGETAVRIAGGNPGDGAVIDAFYGTLSTQSHARSRMTQRHWECSEDGESMFVRAVPEDKIGPQSIAIIACEGALASLRTRRNFSAPA